MIDISIFFVFDSRNVGTIVLSYFNLISRYLFSLICRNERNVSYNYILSVSVLSSFMKEEIRSFLTRH